MSETLTMQGLLDDVKRLRLAREPRRFDYMGIPVHVSHYLPPPPPRKLTRWERFRVWVEGLADRAEVYYHYPRVKREAAPEIAYLIGPDLYVSPRAATAIRLSAV